MIANIAAMVPAAVLALLLWSGAHELGRWLLSAARARPSDVWLARQATGVVTLTFVATALAAAGLLRWQLLAAGVLVPASAGLIRFVRAAGAAARSRTWLARRSHRPAAAARDAPALAIQPVWIPLFIPALLAVLLLADQTLVPVFHYDLLANYLGVAKEYLIAGNSAPLPHNIFSSLSLPLHALFTYPLALGELINRSPFLFGHGEVYAALQVLLLLLAAVPLDRIAIAGSVLPGRRERRLAVALTLLLWVSLPQTPLLVGLHSAEVVTTYLALVAVALALTSKGGSAADGIVTGALGGLLLAAKLQLVTIIAVCALYMAFRGRSRRCLTRFAAAAAVVMLLFQLRNWSAFGNPLFPYLGGSGAAAATARGLLATNAVSYHVTLSRTAANLFRFLTQQPETGITFAALAAAAFGRVRSGWLYAFALTPVLAISAITDNAYNALRWAQVGALLLLLIAAINLAPVVARSPLVRWATAVFLTAALLLAGGFTGGLLGLTRHLYEPRDVYLASEIPSYPVRRALVQEPGRALYLGEISAFYGARNGLLPSPQDHRFLDRYFGTTDPREIGHRLAADRIRWVALNRRTVRLNGDEAPWPGLPPKRAAALRAFLATQIVAATGSGITVYDVEPGITTRGSPPSPP